MSYFQSRGYHRDRYRSTEIACNPYSDLSYGNRQDRTFTTRPSKRRRSDAPARSDSVGDRWNLSQRREEDADLLSRDEIERCSPSRKDGIDSALETRLRYSYCSYLQNLGMRLELPQTTIGTAAVLCHRFFFRRSHACHDRFLIATAALFLAAKSEETPCLLNTLLRASCEVCQHQEFAYLPYLFHGDWFDQYRERVTDAEQMILTTLDFELDVKHPYAPLTSVLTKLGLSHTVLFSVAWNLVNKGVFLEENNVLTYVNVLSWRIDNAVHGKHIFDSKKLRNSNFWILLYDNGIQSSFWSLKMANRPLNCFFWLPIVFALLFYLLV
ncbi:cyclin-T1-4-like isoform X2 [Typha latifolia]|uniref:cyclin-T1-4-like isoform X2 n=1 Tax=Typha latifolia TaxID=4733 RepID=UPI003C2AE26F